MSAHGGRPWPAASRANGVARTDNSLWEIAIPIGATATVYVPAADSAKVTESDKPAADAVGVKFLRQEDGAAIYEVGSGKYTFRVKQ